MVVCEDPRAALAYAAALFFGAQPEVMVAVTGTIGKTSVATFTRQIWQVLGYRAVNLGTMGVLGDYSAKLAHTTPEPVTLHRLLAEMAPAPGSTMRRWRPRRHGLDQRRLDGVRLTAAAFTNFSQDHLDYHARFRGIFRRQGRAVRPGAARGRRGGDQHRRSARPRDGAHRPRTAARTS